MARVDRHTSKHSGRVQKASPSDLDAPCQPTALSAPPHMKSGTATAHPATTISSARRVSRPSNELINRRANTRRRLEARLLPAAAVGGSHTRWTASSRHMSKGDRPCGASPLGANSQTLQAAPWSPHSPSRSSHDASRALPCYAPDGIRTTLWRSDSLLLGGDCAPPREVQVPPEPNPALERSRQRGSGTADMESRLPPRKAAADPAVADEWEGSTDYSLQAAPTRSGVTALARSWLFAR